ncbi:MAG TPA: DUF1571 domain-containing protein [Planctomycetaceae bacterium]|jgi:hypothetical protein|nr:DUF1571 domain-containing protein [Planctomycetaceae bacterium]
MATLIAYWRGSTRRRLLKGLAGLAACLAPLVWLALNPSAAVRIIEWGLSRKRSNRDATMAAVPQRSETPASASDPARPPALSASGRSQTSTSSVLLPAIAASIGVPRIGNRLADGRQPVGAVAKTDEHKLELLQRVCDLLKAGRDRFVQIPAYSATFIKRERIGSDLTELTTLELKVRHQSFAIYLKWLEGQGVGKEVLYNERENDGNLLVRLGGVKGRLIPAFKLDAGGVLAMGESRYPITKAGIVGLTESLIAHREQELQNQVYAQTRQEADGFCDGRRCAVYVFEFDGKDRSPDYRKSIQYLDRQWNVPLQVENYGWLEPGRHLEGAALDEATLIEYYKYSNLVVDGHLTDDDFSPSNPEYRFRR